MKRKLQFLIPFTVLCFSALSISGCNSNPTNEPTADEINQAVEAKYKAIDADPKMTDEQKAELKKHIAGPAKADAGTGRR